MEDDVVVAKKMAKLMRFCKEEGVRIKLFAEIGKRISLFGDDKSGILRSIFNTINSRDGGYYRFFDRSLGWSGTKDGYNFWYITQLKWVLNRIEDDEPNDYLIGYARDLVCYTSYDRRDEEGMCEITNLINEINNLIN